VKVMGQVMQKVLSEGVDGEPRAIGTSSHAPPVALTGRVEGGGG